MKKALFVIMALLLAIQIPLSAKEKPGKIITYTIIQKGGCIFGFNEVKKQKRKDEYGIHYYLECTGCGFRACKFPFIQVSDEYLHVQDVIVEKINDMIEYCNIQVSNQIYKGEYSKKIYVTLPQDKHNRILILRIKWQMQNNSTDGVINIIVEETDKIRLF